LSTVTVNVNVSTHGLPSSFVTVTSTWSTSLPGVPPSVSSCMVCVALIGCESVPPIVCGGSDCPSPQSMVNE
jgi:hypothetical protein